MGFRDIQAFNLAMLSKQAWRLIHYAHSLFYRVCVYIYNEKPLHILEMYGLKKV